VGNSDHAAASFNSELLPSSAASGDSRPAPFQLISCVANDAVGLKCLKCHE